MESQLSKDTANVCAKVCSEINLKVKALSITEMEQVEGIVKKVIKQRFKEFDKEHQSILDDLVAENKQYYRYVDKIRAIATKRSRIHQLCMLAQGRGATSTMGEGVFLE